MRREPLLTRSGAPLAGSNQVLGLLEALIRMRAWTAAEELVLLLEDAGCFDIGTHPPVRSALCELLHCLVEPLYATVSPRANGIDLLSGPSPAAGTSIAASTSSTSSAYFQASMTSFQEIPSVLLGPLRLLGVGLHSDVVLFAKLCRVLLALLKSHVTLWTDKAAAPLCEAVSEIIQISITAVLQPAALQSGRCVRVLEFAGHHSVQTALSILRILAHGADRGCFASFRWRQQY